jgi:peptidoglycan/LPS O-acetylase OafA/YrhL
MDAIALGCITALLTAKRHLARPLLWTLGTLGMIFFIFSLCFSVRAYSWGLGRNGLNMTILAVGTCMLIVLAAQTEWHAPRICTPLLRLGQRSYEVYLTHEFIVLGLFSLFVMTGKPIKEVPLLFIAVMILSGLFGELVARGYSEPMNRWLRKRWGDGPGRLGSAISSV